MGTAQLVPKNTISAIDSYLFLGYLSVHYKFEFGILDDEIVLIDEVLTPDSSRFWPKSTYKPGGAQKSFDKQFLRDYLLTLDWDKTSPGPTLPKEIIMKTAEKYDDAMNLFVDSEK